MYFSVDGNLGRPRLTLAQLPPPLCSLWWWGSLSSGTDVKSADWASNWITDSPELQTLGERQKGRQTVSLNYVFVFLCCVFLEVGSGVKALRQKRVCFLYLFGLKEYLFKNPLPRKSSGTEMELPILWEYLPLLTKQICKGMWHNYSNSPDTDSKWLLSTPHSKSQKKYY